MNAEHLMQVIKTGSTQEAFDAADQLEQLSRHEPRALWVIRPDIFDLINRTSQPGLMWQLAIIVPRVPWSDNEAATLIYKLSEWITVSASVIVKADALSAICLLALEHLDYMPIAKRYLARALKFGSAAEQARARSLIGRVEPEEH